MPKVSMFSLSSGQRAYLTTQLQSKVFTTEKAAEYAKNQWHIDIDVASIDAYMNDKPDPLSPIAQPSPSDIHEIAISSALARDLKAVEEGLTLIQHQYTLKSGKIIDLLCNDKHKNYVVIEVKKFPTKEVLNQLLGYMSDLRDEYPQAEIRGIVMSNSYEEDLARKIKLLKGSKIELKYYRLKVLPASEEEIKGVSSS